MRLCAYSENEQQRIFLFCAFLNHGLTNNFLSRHISFPHPWFGQVCDVALMSIHCHHIQTQLDSLLA